MKKKSSLSAQKSLARKNHIAQLTPAVQQSFWFRLWIGILIGSKIGFAMLAVSALTNPNPAIRAILPLYQGVFFIILALIYIFFMTRLLQFKRYGLYGTIIITLINLLLNIYWHADLLTSLALSIIPVAITLLFVVPQWRYYN